MAEQFRLVKYDVICPDVLYIYIYVLYVIMINYVSGIDYIYPEIFTGIDFINNMYQ